MNNLKKFSFAKSALKFLFSFMLLITLANGCEESENSFHKTDRLRGKWIYQAEKSAIQINISGLDYAGFSSDMPYYWLSYYDNYPQPHDRYIADYKGYVTNLQNDEDAIELDALHNSQIIHFKDKYHFILGDVTDENAQLIGYIYDIKNTTLKINIQFCQFNGKLINKTVVFNKVE